MSFIISTGSNYINDWYWHGSSTRGTNLDRWKINEKTIYDPCPNGWRVPDKIWTDSGLSTNAVSADSENKGVVIGTPYVNTSSWYPATGFYYSDKGYIDYPQYGYYWSVDTRYSLYINVNTGIQITGSNSITYPYPYAHGWSVRCCKEE